MAESNSNEIMNNEQVLKELKKSGHFDISVCDNVPNIDDNPKFKKLELTTGQKMQMTALAGALPSVLATDAVSGMAAITANLWVMDFPLGIPFTMVELGQGGFSNTLRGLDGRFVAQASLYPVGSAVSQQLATQAAIMGTFSAMSIVSGQYFLKQINSELSRIKYGMDKILEFLYGDKKAELMSEINFAKYAYENFGSIMSRPDQRAATIASLQEGKKVAMKDAEFYISDIASTMQESFGVESIVEKACAISNGNRYGGLLLSEFR